MVSLSGKMGGSLLARTASRIAGGDGSWAERRAATELVATLGKMKGLAQKLGQVISMDMDRVPPEVREIISALQGKSEPMDYRAIAAVVEEELGAPPTQIFASFEEKPFAAASLGQVHRARLHSGREVAVKVQYPGVAESMTADLANLDALLKTMGSLVGSTMKGRGYYHELQTELHRETDYRLEAQNAARFRALLAPFPEIVVPEVIADHSAARVLTLEYLGKRAAAVGAHQARQRSNERGALRRLRASDDRALRAWSPGRQGVVHADPHPGKLPAPARRPNGSAGLRGGQAALGAGGGGEPQVLSRHPRGQAPGPHRAASSWLRLRDQSAHEQELRALWPSFFFLLARPALAVEFDYATSTLVAEAEAFVRKNLLTLLKVKPPAEGMMFFRAVGGHSQNLRALGARGSFRDVYRQVLERVTEERAQPAA